MPEGPFTQSVEQWRDQKLAQIQFRPEKTIHAAFCASAMVIMSWTPDMEITEEEYDAGIAASKAY